MTMCNHSFKATNISFNIHFRHVAGKYFEFSVTSFYLVKANCASQKPGLISGKNMTSFDNMNVPLKEIKDIFISNW